MSGFSDYLENAIVAATLRGGSLTGGTVYAALFDADPTDADLVSTEVSDSGYVRKQCHTTTASDGFTNPNNGVTTNAKTITFNAIVDAQVIATHWAIFDAQTNGNMLYHAALTTPKTLDISDVLSFPIGALSITLS